MCARTGLNLKYCSPNRTATFGILKSSFFSKLLMFGSHGYHCIFPLATAGANNNWLCEFCKTNNRDVDVNGWTKPATGDVTYELQAPPNLDGKEIRLEENHSVIFVIDISGSMSSTKQVQRRL